MGPPNFIIACSVGQDDPMMVRYESEGDMLVEE